MRRLTFAAALMAATLMLGACKDSPTQTDQAAASDDYALVVFGVSGAALQSTLGPQSGRPFDGRTGTPHFPDSLALTAEQTAAIDALRSTFETTHQAQLDALRAIFEEARAAREAGEPRDSIRAILQESRAIGEAIRGAVEALHQSILGVFTDEQHAWLEAHRPPPPRDMDGRQHPPGPGRGGPPPR